MVRKFCKRLMLVWLVVFVVFAGCQSDSVISPVESQVTTGQEEIVVPPTPLLGWLLNVVNRLLGAVVGLITPQSGGTLHLLTSDFVVPANAVTSSVHVAWAIREQIPAGLNGGLNRVHEFGPEGLQFQISSSLHVSYSDAGLGTRDPNLYRCYYFNESTNTWEPQATVVDAVNRRFIVTINHFSRYAFGR